MKTKGIFIALFLICYCTSCHKGYELNTPETVFKNILDKNYSDTSSIMRLDSLLSFEWDKMIILQPYENTILKDCGFDFDLPDSKIKYTEGSEEYIFIKNKKIIKHLIHKDSAKAYIRLVLDTSLINTCGVQNSSQVVIKFVSNTSKDFLGKTYLVFKK